MSSESKPFLKYTDSDTSSTHSSSTFPPTPPPQYLPALERHYPKVISYGVVFVLTSSFWMIVIFLFVPSPTDVSRSTSTNTYYDAAKTHNITSGARLLTCGENKSNQEARARGCKYDILLNGWVPEPCYDEEFVLSYKDDGSYAAFADYNMTIPLTTVDEMAEAGSYYTSARDHVNHCATMWKKQFWVLFEERRQMDSFIASPGHTDHCAQFLMDVGDMDGSLPTKVDVGFAGCWVKN